MSSKGGRRLPVRGEGVRALGVPLPPAPMPLLRGGRPLKRWRYVGLFGPEVMLCAADAHVGPLGQRFWALAEPGGRLLHARSLVGSGGLSVSGPTVRLRGRGRQSSERVALDLILEPGEGPPAVESVSPAGARGYVWTRKCAGIPAHGTLGVDGRARSVAGEAVTDDTAGYHPRHTLWRWAAGVGRTVDGRRVGWNLVEGVNDDPHASERTLWVDGGPAEVEPVRIADDLSAIGFADGCELHFRPWATLAHRTRLGLVRSDYRQPFGTFTGDLPGGLGLAEGYGVTERHEAWW